MYTIAEIESAFETAEMIHGVAAPEPETPVTPAPSTQDDPFHRDDISDHISKILSGEALHEGALKLSSSLIARGVPPPTTKDIVGALAIGSNKDQSRIDEFLRRGGELDRMLDGAFKKFVKPQAAPLPPIVKSTSYKGVYPALEEEIIGGVLRKKSKLMIGSVSKGNKSWLANRLALSVAHGVPFLVHPCTKTRTLVLNLELKESTYLHRNKPTGEAMGVSPESDCLDFWHLRGCDLTIEDLIPRIVEAIKDKGYGLIIIDPLYKLYGSRQLRQFSENDAGDVAYLLRQLDRLTIECGVALAIIVHFSKGNQSAKSAMDRVAGSGVFARDFDSILTLSELDLKDSFRLEYILREFKSPDPLNLRWEFPLHRVDGSLANIALRGAKDNHSKAMSEKGAFLAHLEDGKEYRHVDLVSLIVNIAGKQPKTAETWISNFVKGGSLMKNASGRYMKTEVTPDDGGEDEGL